MSINWQDLRSLHNSQQSAFEELTCQLAGAEVESVPVNAKFIRKGAPDAGVECYWQFPDGTEWGWQAKFFRSTPGTAQWKQVDDSLKTALDKHPKLQRYIICFPIDRQDPRIPQQNWFMDQWDAHVVDWKLLASAKGMAVEFDYWGSHEFLTRLSREEHAGRFYFWFQRNLFSKEWYRNRVDEAIENVGPRYSPQLDVQLPIAHLFHGMGRSSEFCIRIKSHLKKIQKAYPRSRIMLDAICLQKLEDSYTQLNFLIGSLEPSNVNRIDWDGILSLVRTAISTASELAEECTIRASSPNQKKIANNHREENDQLRYLATDYHRLSREYRSFQSFIDSNEVRLSNTPALLLVAEAGRGKTHLFCDVARHRLESGAPTILLIGGQFTSDEPWGQSIQLLGLTCSREEFIGALEASAQASGTRAMILIDALNEGEGKGLWKKYLAGFLLAISKSPWLTVAFSVRTSYVETVLPDGLIPVRLIREEHQGFAEHEYQATKTFFEFYGIQRPSIPMLVPEFQNPLFLKLFCQSLQNSGMTRIPSGMHGITAIFQFFLNSVNTKLAEVDYLDYHVKQNIVGRAVSALAAELAQRHVDWLPIVDAQEILDQVLHRDGYEKSLYRHLLSEGVIAENRFYGADHERIEGVHFAYERFTDHIIAKHLLDKYLNINTPTTLFIDNGPLAHYTRDRHSCVIHQGLMESWSVQIPERTGKELFELAPHISEYDSTIRAFIESIVWRDPRHFNLEVVNAYINAHIVQDDYALTYFLNALLTVAVNPDHPLNVDFLHRKLINLSLAQRDGWWSIFLHEQYGAHEAVDRLVEWAWSEESKSHIADEPIRLYGIVLGWFLTTSHRFLRDRTTKALVRLFTNRLSILSAVIHQFIGVNDLYVLERLMAVAYGCVLRSQEPNEVRKLAIDIYTWIFHDGNPPVHILLRDYARGVIEVALHHGISLDIDVDKVRPPYGSSFPENIPTKEELKAQYNSFEAGKKDIEYAQSEIWFSVIEGGDFDRYVIGTNSGGFEWSNRKLDEVQHPTKKEQYEAFKATLTTSQIHSLEQYQRLLENVDFYRRLDPDRRKEVFKGEFTDEQLNDAIVDTEMHLRRKLGKRKSTAFTEDIIQYLRNPHEDDLAFDLSLAQRWIIKRVFDLGWTAERFGHFDRFVNYNDGRETRKPERIGKKYQWIAFHEFLARVADNFVFRSESWQDPPVTSYDGPWQEMYIRDIDPSWILPDTKQTSSWHRFTPTWWAPISKEWDDSLHDYDWIRKSDDLPDIRFLITTTNQADNSNWLTLEGFYRWEDPDDNSYEESQFRQRTLNYSLQAYLVDKGRVDLLYDWMRRQWRSGQSFRLPETHSLYRVFLGEFFWSPAFLYHYVPYYHHDGWIGGKPNDAIPYPLLVTTDQYTQEGNGFDCSIEDTVRTYLPCKHIVDGMHLRWNGIEGQFIDSQGALIAMDPSVHTKGPGTLLIRREPFLSYLHENNYAVLWVITGEKLATTGDFGSRQNWPGRLNIFGVYRLDGPNLEGEVFTSVGD